MNNTGNKPVIAPNVQINATNLRGEQNSELGIWAGNFSVSTDTGGSCTGPSCIECGDAPSTTMSAGIFTNLTVANLTRGNYTINNGTGQEGLYFCIKLAGNELTTQAYSTANESAWTVRIEAA